MKSLQTVALLFLWMLSLSQASAQSKELWLDYYAVFLAGRYWSYEINPGVSKGLTDPVWLDTYVSGNATYQDQNWLSTEGNLEFHYTFNTTTENVREIRPWLGANFIWPTFGGALNLYYPTLSLRFEERFLSYMSSGNTATKERIRLRVFTKLPLNDESMRAGTYYLIFLLETYVPLDGDAKEISADKRRFQIGLGYVMSPAVRLELQYLLMRERNTAENRFENSSNIFWFAFRNYF